ncbi:MAG: HEAT repeat domain-containing protein [Halothece sp.]
MKALTNALNRILHWHQQHHTEWVESKQPGLTTEEIKIKTQELPFRLPTEVYELYQWCNGTSGDVPFFPSYRFLSLEEAVDLYHSEIKEVEIDKLQQEDYYDIAQLAPFSWPSFQNQYWLPIFDFDGEIYFLSCDTEQRDGAPVWYYFPESVFPRLYFSNLTSMLLAITECYETEAYYLDQQGFLEENELKVAPILRKYSPVSELSLRKLRPQISLVELSEIAGDLMLFKDPRAVEPLLQIINSPQPESMTWHEYAGLQGLVARILSSIGDPKAVTSLIQISQAEEWMTRYWIAIALGELKDSRAVDCLVTLLADSKMEVRQMAIWALGEIGNLATVKPLAQLAEADDVEDTMRSAATEALTKIESRNLKR